MRQLITALGLGGLLVLAQASRSAEAQGSPKLPVPPPKNALVLFDGKDASAWVHKGAKACGWKVADGAIEIVTGTGDLFTKKAFGDFQLHVEFNLPLMADKTDEARANSGVILQDLYEIQLLDSYGTNPPRVVDCGAVYKQTAPKVNACKPPEQWQSYDITFRAARFDSAGKVTENPRVTLLQNGINVQDNTEILSATGARKGRALTPTGPVLLQDHHANVKFRNIWIIPAKGA